MLLHCTLEYLISVQIKRSHSIHMLSIQIDTKSLELIICHHFNNFKLSLFASHMKLSLIDAVRLLDTQKRPPAISLFYKRRAFQKHVICEKNHWGGNCISLNVFEAFSKFCKSLESFNSITLLFLNAEHDLSIKFSAWP